jgi:hypothetical protein
MQYITVTAIIASGEIIKKPFLYVYVRIAFILRTPCDTASSF